MSTNIFRPSFLSLPAGLMFLAFGIGLASCHYTTDPLKEGFLSPPDSSRPGVYWYFMDGNLNEQAMTADLESMKKAGIGYVLFLEVNVGVPRGKVDFLSDEWQDLFEHVVRECERLGIRLILGSGPGWAGSGGPWVKPEQSMQHLVASAIEIRGPMTFNAALPVPPPRTPFFGAQSLTENLRQQRDTWFEDVAVMAFPTPARKEEIPLVDEKALYYRAPYTSQPGVVPFIEAPAIFAETGGSAIDENKIIDLTDRLLPGGMLHWEVPPGYWTILRFVKRNNGAVTRPAPLPGLGFECDKFDTVAFDAHYNTYVGALIRKVKPRRNKSGGGWTMIHIDSWEMGAQNWSPHFREEFLKRRGYDPLPFLPAYTGRIVGSREQSERFLWDVRLTSMELILENHAGRFRDLGRQHGLRLSIEPYDMNPAADLDLGSVADVPMCEFWSNGYGFNSSFSCIESSSVAHVLGRPVVAAEAFTADNTEAWKKYPGNMKDQGDWAFCMGINRLVYHTFTHKALDDAYRPGMTMGPYGVHWDRGQTWWPMISAYHRYITRCQYLLSQGQPLADILYLAPEGAPHVFRPPSSAMDGTAVMPDKRGYAFDGCSPRILIEKASVKDHKIVFPGGASYHLLVLPAFETMTPELLQKIGALIEAGAYVVGTPPKKSPSLEHYPSCDSLVRRMALTIWGDMEIPAYATVRRYRNGSVLWGGELSHCDTGEIYPAYEPITDLLIKMDVRPDFASNGFMRYTHRSLPDREIYFLSNRTDKLIHETCLFRDGTTNAELWDAVTGEIHPLSQLENTPDGVRIRLTAEAYQSFFIVFYKKSQRKNAITLKLPDFPEPQLLARLNGPWRVSFDTCWGGPAVAIFDSLCDWTLRPEEGIRHYSGIACYTRSFDIPAGNDLAGKEMWLDLGTVNCLARIRLNGHDLGVVWTPPLRVKINDMLRGENNKLEIEVANLWVNRLIGDENLPYDGVVKGQWPAWLLNGTQRPTKRYTFSTHRYYTKNDPLQPSGLIGPVRILWIKR